MPYPFRYGEEFLINTHTSGPQVEPTIAGLADGRFVVSWADEASTGADVSGSGIKVQMFNADGSAAGVEFVANTITVLGQYGAAVTALADGRFVISWDDSSKSGTATGVDVRAQMLNADGSKSGQEIVANTTDTGSQHKSAVTSLANGGFVITWEDHSQSGGDTSETAVRAQVFKADGSRGGAEILVNTTTAGGQSEPTVTGLAEGRFVVSWADNGGALFDPAAWSVRAQLFEADGTKAGSEIVIGSATRETRVTSLEDGGFVLTWVDLNGAAPGGVIHAQLFSSNASTLGPEFLVNTTTVDDQSHPVVTGLADGRFVIAWTDSSASGKDTSLQAIRAQVFNIDGSKAGGEFLVNTTTPQAQTQPAVTALGDGRFVVVWQDESATGGDTSGAAIRGQIFDPRESAVQLYGSMLNDDFVGTRFGDQIFGFVGDDTLLGRNGSDLLNGEEGNDTLRGGGGNDRLSGEAGNDFLAGGSGADQLLGGGGRDYLKGGFGLDYLAGGKGNDTYVVDNSGDVVAEKSGQGTDTIESKQISLDLADYANVEKIRLLGPAALDATGDAGNNALTGNVAENQLLGLGGKDVLRGGGGADDLDGGGGNDKLFGDAGADRLSGGLGRDLMTGGAGADVFVFAAANETGTTAASRDTIRDFSQAAGDRIDLSAIDAGGQVFSYIGATAFSSAQAQLRYYQTANETILQGDIDGDGVTDFEILLNGLIDLTAGDFIL